MARNYMVYMGNKENFMEDAYAMRAMSTFGKPVIARDERILVE